MRILVLLALVLALGLGLLLLLLDDGAGERGGLRGGRPATLAPSAGPENETETAPERSGETPAGARPAQRLSLDPAPPAEPRRVLEGALIGDGAPLPGATLELFQGEEAIAEARSDERGRFRLSYAPRQSALTLRVRARGFVPLERSLGYKPIGGTEILGNLRLTRGTELSGRVVDGRGLGIADAVVQVQPRGSGTDVLRAEARSGPDGRFRLGDAPAGAVSVRARAPGFGERTFEARAGPGAPEVELALEPGSTLRLLVRSPRGDPIAGAEVAIRSTDPQAPARNARSDQHGRVVFDSLSAPVWNATVTHPDYQPSSRGPIQASGAEVAIECTPWPAIAGRVLAPGGSSPPSGTLVQALPASAPGDRIALAAGGRPVAPDGSFKIGGLRQGEWVLRASAPGFGTVSSVPVRLGMEGDAWAGILTLQSAARLVLAVTLKGEPLAGAEAEAQPAQLTSAQLWALQESRTASASGRRGRSGSDGRIELSELSAGPTWVAVFAPGCPPRSAGPFALSSGETMGPIPIELERGARIRGRVLQESGGPLPGAQVRISDRGGKLGFPLLLLADAEGRYATAWLPAGTYVLEAFVPSQPGRRSGEREIELQTGEEREENPAL
jgi:hypothetical protein